MHQMLIPVPFQGQLFWHVAKLGQQGLTSSVHLYHALITNRQKPLFLIIAITLHRKCKLLGQCRQDGERPVFWAPMVRREQRT